MRCTEDSRTGGRDICSIIAGMRMQKRFLARGKRKPTRKGTVRTDCAVQTVVVAVQEEYCKMGSGPPQDMARTVCPVPGRALGSC